MRRRAEEARAVDDVGPVVEQRPEHLRVLVGVVLEVGVLHDDVVGRDLGEAASQRRALALVDRLLDDAHPRVGRSRAGRRGSRRCEPSSTMTSSATNGDASTRSTMTLMVARSLKQGITTAKHRGVISAIRHRA